jgi:hypothetical protein
VNWEGVWRHSSTNRFVNLSAFGSDFEDIRRQDDGETRRIGISLGPPELDGDLPSEPSFTSDFGENLLGVKNMRDLSDLIAAKDKEFQVLHDAVSKTPTSSPPWPAAPNDYRAWYTDYQTLLSQWQSARAAAITALNAAGTSSVLNPLAGLVDMNTQTGEPYYGNIIKVLQPAAVNPSSIDAGLYGGTSGRYGGGTSVRGDLHDLAQRLNAIQTIPAYTVPQPTRGADQENTFRNAFAPLDPLGNPKTGEDWKRDALFAGAILVGALFLASVVAQKV